MPKFYVTWSGWIVADDSHQAENKIENAVSSQTDADLDDCNATNEDTDDLDFPKD